MKKIFTLALVLLVATAGYSQVRKVSKTENFENVQSEPLMTRSDGELDYTTYDWQTNAGPRNWTIQWPDGKVNFAYNYASLENLADSGTGIGTYDATIDAWIPLDGRIEAEKTSFGSIARFKENGIVVAANTASSIGVFIVEDKDHLMSNSVLATSYLDPTNDPRWPAVMTSGANRDIIHIIATGYADNKLYYFRSIDSGESWDKENVILPYLTEEYGSFWGSHVAYWMETTEDNCLALVVNNPWSDGMVIYSRDDGETWERKLFYHHPGINTTFDDWFMYPRWTSCVWGDNDELRMAYEFNCSTGEPGSGRYNPAIGGVAFWSESLPHQSNGQPFIMDAEYIRELWDSSPYFHNPPYQIWPEYFGYVENELDSLEFHLDDFSLHGDYKCGPVAMPVLIKVPDHDPCMVAVWISIDENNIDLNGNYYFKLWAAVTTDGGHYWWNKVELTDDFLWEFSEFVYPQVAVSDMTLVIAAQCDYETGSHIQNGNIEYTDTYYQGFTFELYELFPIVPFDTPEVEHNTHVSVYPNPAVDQLHVTLSKNADIVIYNIMGQAVMNVEGHIGANNLDISELNDGVYFVKAGSGTQKFVVK